MFSTDEFVLETVGFRLSEVRDEFQPGRQAWRGTSVGLRNLREKRARLPVDGRRVCTDLAEEFRDDALALFDERDQKMLGFDLRMARLLGELLRADDRFLGLLRVLVNVHGRRLKTAFL